MTKQQRHMVSIVRAIAAGKWTDEAPRWALPVLQQSGTLDDTDMPYVVRAVQTAEAFCILLLAEDSSFDVQAFVTACGFRR